MSNKNEGQGAKLSPKSIGMILSVVLWYSPLWLTFFYVVGFPSDGHYPAHRGLIYVGIIILSAMVEQRFDPLPTKARLVTNFLEAVSNPLFMCLIIFKQYIDPNDDMPVWYMIFDCFIWFIILRFIKFHLYTKLTGVNAEVVRMTPREALNVFTLGRKSRKE